MRVRVVKDLDVDDDVVEHILNEFIDWVDEQGLVRQLPSGMEFNSDLVAAYLTDKGVE